MLRYLMLAALRFCALVTLVGVLVSRAWGWNEYTSPELFVVYYQIVNARNQYALVSVDRADDDVKLRWNDSPIAKVDCSPDGRTFAFMTDDAHLYVMTRDGLLYERAEDRLYTTVNVANDGTTALFDPATGWLVIDTNGIDLSARNSEIYPLDRVDISSQGLVLWNRHFEEIEVFAPPAGEVVSYIPRGHSGVWLAAGQMFTFYDLITDRDGLAIGGGQYVMDVAAQKLVRIGGWTVTRPLSPDGMKVAAALPTRGSNNLVQVVVYDLFTNQNRRQLTHAPDTASQPICFLTFRPERLTASTE